MHLNFIHICRIIYSTNLYDGLYFGLDGEYAGLDGEYDGEVGLNMII